MTAGLILTDLEIAAHRTFLYPCADAQLFSLAVCMVGSGNGFCFFLAALAAFECAASPSAPYSLCFFRAGINLIFYGYPGMCACRRVGFIIACRHCASLIERAGCNET